MKRLFTYYRFVFFLFVCFCGGVSVQAGSNYSDSITSDERELYELIMHYRQEKGLPRVPLSASLTYVAQTHARDMYYHFSEIPNGCNMHSWSAYGPWSKCDYYPDHRNAKGMWIKPKELTPYTGTGYEIAQQYLPPTSGIYTPMESLQGWQNSPGHNAVMVNLNTWSDVNWQAIGIGMYKGCACVWFGEEKDPVAVTPYVRSQPASEHKTPGSEDKHSPSESNKTDTNGRQQYRLKMEDDYKPTTTGKHNGDMSSETKTEHRYQPSTTIKTTQQGKKTGIAEYRSYRKSAVKEQPEPSEGLLSRYYEHNGRYYLSFFSAGYTYSFIDRQHLLTLSLLDFRTALFGFSPLAAELTILPWDETVSYKPSVRLYIPLAKNFAIVPYASAAIDVSYLGKYFVKDHDYNMSRDFHATAIAGVALNFSALTHMPVEIKAEYRHPIVIPAYGEYHSRGAYIGVQIYFGKSL